MALSFQFVFLFAISIYVSTSKPYGIVVIDTTAESTTIQWKTTEKATNIERFKIHCNGTRHYMSVDGLESLDVAEKIQYAPAGKFQIFIGDLQANFNYSCNIWEDVDYGTQVFRGEVSETFKFSTDYGVPEKPRAPEIQKNDKNHSIIVHLFSTSTRFGPISGYHVQFHFVESKTDENLPLIDDDVFEPFSPLPLLLPMNEARKLKEPQSFWIDFPGGKLPTRIVIDNGLLNNSLKYGREYTVVTVPYTLHNKFNETTMLFTPSNMSAIFKTYSLTTEQLLNANETEDLAIAISLGVILPLVVLGYLGCFGCLVICILWRKKKKGKKHSRRDVVETLMRERAEEQGADLPWYYQQTSEETRDDQSRNTSINIPPSQTRQEQEEGKSTKQSYELEAAIIETEQSSCNKEEPLSQEQDNLMLLLSPNVAETDMGGKQFLTVPSLSVTSVELWTTPNTSPSNSLITEHATQLVQTSEVEEDDYNMLEYTSVVARNQSSSLSTESCLSGQEVMPVPKIITTNSGDSEFGIDKRSLNDGSLSETSTELSEQVSVPDELLGDAHRTVDNISDLGETFTDSGNDTPFTDEHADSNIEYEVDILGKEESLTHLSLEYADTGIELGSMEDVSTIKEHQSDEDLQRINSNTDIRETVFTKLTDEPITGEIQLHSNPSDKSLQDIKLEVMGSCNDFGEEVSIKESFLNDEKSECFESILDLSEEESVYDHTTDGVLEDVHNGVKVEEASVMEESLTGKALEYADSRIDLNDELSVSEEKVRGGVLKRVDSSIDLRDKESVMNEPSTINNVNYDENMNSLSEEVLPVDQHRNLEHIDSITDLREDVPVTEESVNESELFQHADSRSEIGEQVEGSCEECPVVAKSLSDTMLTRVKSNIDLREDMFDGKMVLTRGIIKRVNSSIDLSEELSIMGFQKESIIVEVDLPTSIGEEKLELKDRSLGLLLSDSDSGNAQTREESKINVQQYDSQIIISHVEDNSASFKVGSSECEGYPPPCIVEDTDDPAKLFIESDDEKLQLIDVQSMPKTSFAVYEPSSQQLPRAHSPPLEQRIAPSLEQRLASSSCHRSQCHSQSNLSRQSGIRHHLHSSTSLPDMSWNDSGHRCQLQLSKSVGLEVSNHEQWTPPTSNVKNEIYDAHSIQLSQISNQSRSTSSGNYSLASQMFKHSVSGSSSELSGHYRPPSTRSSVNQPFKMTSNRSKSSLTHSITSQEYKYSESGSSDIIFSKTVETQQPVKASLDDQVFSTHCSSKLIESTVESFVEPYSDNCTSDVLTVTAEHDLQAVHSSKENNDEIGSPLLVPNSQEIVGLYHSKPTLNLADEHLGETCPHKDSVLQMSDSVAIQMEEPYAESKGEDVSIIIDLSTFQPFSTSSQLSFDHINSGIPESQGHVAVPMDTEVLDTNNTKSSALNSVDTTSSSSEISHCSTSTVYHTALENLDLSSQSSDVGLLHPSDKTHGTGQSAVMSSGSGSEHRDSNQVIVEPMNHNNFKLMKMSSSASLFIPRGLSGGPSDKSASIHQERGSTNTLASILAQLSESSVSGEEQHHGVANHDHNVTPIYEPY